MSNEEKRQELIQYWFEKARESLDSARDEQKANRLPFAVNRLYYACFYAVSALLLMNQLTFKKHSGVRSAFHRHFIKTALVQESLGQLYDELFEARQRGDYLPFIVFEEAVVGDWIKRTDLFLNMLPTVNNEPTSPLFLDPPLSCRITKL